MGVDGELVLVMAVGLETSLGTSEKLLFVINFFFEIDFSSYDTSS